MNYIITLLVFSLTICKLRADKRAGYDHAYFLYLASEKNIFVGDSNSSHLVFEKFMSSLRSVEPYPGSALLKKEKKFNLESITHLNDKGNPLAHGFMDTFPALSLIGFHRYFQQYFELPCTQENCLDYIQRAMDASDIPLEKQR